MATKIINGKTVELTEEEVQQFAEREAAHSPTPEYIELRAANYPDIGDQLDAILKGFNHIRINGQSLPQDLDDVLGQWLAVKSKYPKPE